MYSLFGWITKGPAAVAVSAMRHKDDMYLCCVSQSTRVQGASRSGILPGHYCHRLGNGESDLACQIQK